MPLEWSRTIISFRHSLVIALSQPARSDAAISHLQEAVRLNPNYGPGWEQLGFAYQKLGKHFDAIKAYERSVQLDPNSKKTWRQLGQEYRAVGRTADAERAYARGGGGGATVANAGKKKG